MQKLTPLVWNSLNAARLLTGLVVLAFTLVPMGPASAVDVWLTTGDKSSLLEQGQDLIFEPGVGSGGLSISVAPTTIYQTMQGFGASLTDSSAWLLHNAMSASQRDELISLLFSPDTGVGFSYLRLPMGASDFVSPSSGFYTYNDLPSGQTDPAHTQFSIAHDQAYIIPELQQALAINPDLQLMASPWSAPAWMKDSGSLIGGQLQTLYHASYALYFQRFVEAYAAEGLTIDAVSLQNEPLHSPSNYPGMTMTAAQQIDIIKNHLGPRFTSEGIDTDILVYDHNWDNTQFTLDVLNDPLAKQYVAGTAFHGYAGDVTAQTTVHNAHSDRGVYFTEITGGDFAPDFSDNLVYGVKNTIIRNARNWGETAIYWNLALDENNGPHIGGCSDCRGVVTVDSTTGDVTLNEEYYTLAHASKFVQPGAVRIDSRTLEDTLETVAFENPDGSRVLIALNPGNNARTLRVVESGEHFAYTLPGKGVATFTWPSRSADFDNGGFDELGGSLSGWTVFGNATGNVAAAQEFVLEGSDSLKLYGQFNGPGNYSGVSQGMSVQPGDVVRASAYSFIDALDSIAGTENEAVMKIEFFDEFGGQFGTSDLIAEHQITIADGLSVSDVWEQHLLVETAPAGAQEARLVFYFYQPDSEHGSVYLDTTSIDVVSVTSPADFDFDGVVDHDDLARWRAGFGTDTGAGPLDGDADGDADVDLADLLIWQWDYDNSSTLEAQAAPIPEPSCIMFCAVAGTLFLCSKPGVAQT